MIAFQVRLAKLSLSQLQQRRMFYMCRQVQARLQLVHAELKDCGDPFNLAYRAKVAYEGKYYQELGLLVQVLFSQEDFQVNTMKADNDLIQVLVTFTCITFKAQKGDIFDFYVKKVEESMLVGKIGTVEVMVAASRMENFVFNSDRGTFECIDPRFDDLVIEGGMRMRGRCIEWTPGGVGQKMKILAEMDVRMLETMLFALRGNEEHGLGYKG